MSNSCPLPYAQHIPIKKKTNTDPRSWRGTEVSARASILSWAGSLEQPWKGATSVQGHYAPTAAADSQGRLPEALQKMHFRKHNDDKNWATWWCSG